MALTQLSALDASFVRLEEPRVHMHVTWIAFFAPDRRRPRPTVEALRESIDARLPLMPRFRQRVVSPPPGMGDPFWVDDPDFRVVAHVDGYTAPGEAMDHASFGALTDALLSEPLDRRRPLWHLVLVPRLEDGRVGLIGRFHHALVDGTSAMELGLVLFDSADAPPREAAEEGWSPSPLPGPARLAAAAARAQVDVARRVTGRALSAARAPGSAASSAVAALTLASGALREDVLEPAPRSHLNRPVGPARTVALRRLPASALVDVKRAADVTLNDVGLALVAGTLRRLALEVGEAPRALKAMVPVSLHPEDDRARFGNALSFAFLELPVHRADPADRLARVHDRTERFKAVRRPAATALAIDALAVVPGPLRTGLARAANSARMFNLSVSNVRGPRRPFYLLGAELDEAYTLAPLGAEHALSVAFFTYRDGVHFAFQADPDVLGDVDGLPRALDAELDLLADTFVPSRPPASRSAPVA
ncbi:MAG: diacylglycerol O-acyltransferase / wax synthase [Solirubrobacteraceae bacterium]|nr:diacylglycerol O-acyltransferase / wax synthase [Solirubrobacteraceae bacterium]